MATDLAAAERRLQELGLSLVEAVALTGACVEDPRRVLVIAPVPGEPREGDRIRATVRDGHEPESLRVLVAVALPESEPPENVPVILPGSAVKARPNRTRKWAIVGDPVEPSSKDDLALPRRAGT